MKVFSFCLYGSKMKYIKGMHENIQIITSKFPGWMIWIYYGGEDTPIREFYHYPNVICIPGKYTDNQLMLDRFVAFDDKMVEIMFVRDADSRINERDEWCIREFINSPKLFHIVRDHPYHAYYHTPILGGLWGIKKGCLPHFNIARAEEIYIQDRPNCRGFDQNFLGEIIYPKVGKDALIHGIAIEGHNETAVPIPFTSEHIFCGQVIEYDESGREYHNCDDCRIIMTNEDSD